jgi:hypothetical protein
MQTRMFEICILVHLHVCDSLYSRIAITMLKESFIYFKKPMDQKYKVSVYTMVQCVPTVGSTVGTLFTECSNGRINSGYTIYCDNLLVHSDPTV